GFTVTQFAFRSLEPMYGATPSEQQVRSMAIDGSGSSVWEWNARRAEIKTGPLVEMTLGLAQGELTTKVDDFCNHLHEADRERFRLSLWSLQERGGGEIRMSFRMLHSDNSYRWFELEAASVPSNDRRVLRCVGLMREVTEQRRAQERLLYDAVHDSLTGLPNRELFLDRLGVAVTRAKSEPLVRPVVMLIDMDKFKSVNATFGLTFGDSLLLTIARRLQRHLGLQDTLARIGGNQFALMLMQPMEPMEVMQFGERVRRALRSPIRLAGQEIVLTGAIGIAVHEVLVASAEDLFKRAEIAMYRAKRSGADRVELYNPQLKDETDDRAAIENELRTALERDQLFVLYQPIIQLSTEELAGFEAMVRWKHPRLGMLNPDDFIPIAEESDLIVKLGSFVLTQAATEAAKWQRILPRSERPVFVSVNVSSRQLFRPDLMKEIRHIVGRALVPQGVLRLEVAEALVMENPEKAIEQLEALRSAGTGLSLDDFGTGYSSLSYLQRFPFDTIKIDRDLVQATGGDGTGAGSAIVRSIVALAHELGKKVVAEGVEQQPDVGFLRSIGCEYAQGFYYGGPMNPRDVEKMLRQIRKSEHKLHRVGLFRTKSRSERKAARARQPEPADVAEEQDKLEVAARFDKRAEAEKKAAAKGTSLRKRSRPAASKPPPERRPTTQPPPANGSTAPGGPRPPAAAPPSPAAARSAPPHLPPQPPRGNGGAPGFPPFPPPNGTPPPAHAGPLPPTRPLVRANGMPPPGPPPQFNARTPPPSAGNGVHPAGNGDATHGGGRPPLPASPNPAGGPKPAPDLSTLPPAIAASLAKLANTSPSPPRPPANGRSPPRPGDKR
ncbi:MAG: EAL domain-containing protein, partial [Hyphomicrobiaceae bacterium]